MIGDQTGVFIQTPGAVRLQPVCRLVVIHPAQAFQHRFVSHIAQHGMFEEVFIRIDKGGEIAAVHQFPPAQGQQGVDQILVQLQQDFSIFRMHRAQGVIPEGHAHHRSALQGAALGKGQPIQAGLQDAAQGRRHTHLTQALQVDPPGTILAQDRPFIHQHLDQFFDVIGIAGRFFHQQIAERRRHLGHLLQDLRRQLAAGFLRKRLHIQARMPLQPLAPSGIPLVERGARQGEHKQRAVDGLAHDAHQGIQGTIIAPVNILQQQQRRTAGGQFLEEAPQVVQGAVVQLARVIQHGAQVWAG